MPVGWAPAGFSHRGLLRGLGEAHDLLLPVSGVPLPESRGLTSPKFENAGSVGVFVCSSPILLVAILSFLIAASFSAHLPALSLSLCSHAAITGLPTATV